MKHPGWGCPKFNPSGGCDLIDESLGFTAQAKPSVCSLCRQLGGPYNPASTAPRAEHTGRVVLLLKGKIHKCPREIRKAIAENFMTPAEREQAGLQPGSPLLETPKPPEHLDWLVRYMKGNPCGINRMVARNPSMRMAIPHMDEAAKWMRDNR